jgi:MSHA biogenesis protein MshO
VIPAIAHRPHDVSGGFTLIELVVTMSVSTIVVAFAAMFVSVPVQGFMDQSRRVRLVDAADSAVQRMKRDVRRALPNSVRVTTSGSTVALELLGTLDGARYRQQPPGGPAAMLDFTAADDSFNVIGDFAQISKPFSSTTSYLSVYNVGVPGADAYELTNVITPAGTQIDIVDAALPGEDRVTLSPSFRFAWGSPENRVFLVEGPVSYLCDTAAQTLSRYTGYSIAAAHNSRDSAAELLAAGASADVVADRVGACSFTYTSGTAERSAVLTIELQITESGETVDLLVQTHVVNAP